MTMKIGDDVVAITPQISYLSQWCLLLEATPITIKNVLALAEVDTPVTRIHLDWPNLINSPDAVQLQVVGSGTAGTSQVIMRDITQGINIATVTLSTTTSTAVSVWNNFTKPTMACDYALYVTGSILTTVNLYTARLVLRK